MTTLEKGAQGPISVNDNMFLNALAALLGPERARLPFYQIARNTLVPARSAGACSM